MKTQLTIAVIAFTTIAASPVLEKGMSVPQKEKQDAQKIVTGFSSYKIHRQGKNGVTATWSMNSEAGFVCYVLQRTYFDPTDPYSPWDDICVMPCNSSRSYKWTDENVLSGIISYRVKAMMIPSGEMYSGTESIRIVSH